MGSPGEEEEEEQEEGLRRAGDRLWETEFQLAWGEYSGKKFQWPKNNMSVVNVTELCTKNTIYYYKIINFLFYDKYIIYNKLENINYILLKLLF